jgi:hypothetical protein
MAVRAITTRSESWRKNTPESYRRIANSGNKPFILVGVENDLAVPYFLKPVGKIKKIRRRIQG